MNRRQFLSTVTTGTLGLAGCLGSDGDETEVRTVTVTVTREPTTTTTHRSTTSTTSSTTSTTKTTSETETTQTTSETEVTSTTETLDPEEETANHIETAEDELYTAYDQFLKGDAGQDPLTSITATAPSLRESEILNALDSAFSALTTARETATNDQLSLILKLEYVGKFLESTTHTQSAFLKAYAKFDTFVDNTDSDTSTVSSNADALSSAVSNASDQQDDLQSMVLEGFGQVPFMDHNEARAKRKQFRQELEVLKAASSASGPFTTAKDHIATGDSAFESEDWNVARTEYRTAASELASASQALDIENPGAHFTDGLATFENVVEEQTDYATTREQEADNKL